MGGILLQGSQAIAYDESGTQQALVHVLFRCGSERFYVTEHLWNIICLVRETPFGDAQGRARNCKLFKMCLYKPGCSDNSFPQFSCPLLHFIPISNLQQITHLMGLKLADNSRSA